MRLSPPRARRLPSLTLSSQLREIGEKAFSDCSEDFSVLLTSRVCHIDQDTFQGCRFVIVERGQAPHLRALLPPEQHHKVLEMGRGCNILWAVLSPRKEQ